MLRRSVPLELVVSVVMTEGLRLYILASIGGGGGIQCLGTFVWLALYPDLALPGWNRGNVEGLMCSYSAFRSRSRGFGS